MLLFLFSVCNNIKKTPSEFYEADDFEVTKVADVLHSLGQSLFDARKAARTALRTRSKKDVTKQKRLRTKSIYSGIYPCRR